MRSKLKNTYKQRNKFSATFTKYGSFHDSLGNKQTTILIQDIRLGGRIVCDHIWLSDIESIDNLNLQRGDRLEFMATTSQYSRIGLDNNYKKDYELIQISDVFKLCS